MQRIATHSSDSAGRSQGITPPLAREPSWAALLLAWAAAFSDAIGFLVLQQLGASFMSGNSMALGVALGRLDWAAVLQHGLPILVFFLGNLLGFLVLTQVGRWSIRSPFAVVFGLEAVCLLAFLLLGTPRARRAYCLTKIFLLFFKQLFSPTLNGSLFQDHNFAYLLSIRSRTRYSLERKRKIFRFTAAFGESVCLLVRIGLRVGRTSQRLEKKRFCTPRPD